MPQVLSNLIGPKGNVGIILQNGGAVLATGLQRGLLRVDFACTITKWEIYGDQAGAIVVDIWRTTHSAYAPGTHPVDADSITGSVQPTISVSASKAEGTTFTGWNVTLDEGDLLAFNIDSVSTFTWAVVNLTLTKRS